MTEGSRRNLIEIFARHEVASNLAMALMIMAGIWAISQINVQLNPDRDVRYASVGITWRGASAEDMEKLVTTTLEQQIRTVPNVKTLRSTAPPSCRSRWQKTPTQARSSIR